MRCFLAWTPEDRAKRELLALIADLAREHDDPGFRWTREAQLHLTLRFLGESSATQIEALMPSVSALATRTSPIEAWSAGWQYWPSRAAPSVLVLRIESRGLLEEVGRTLEALAIEHGFAPEKRGYTAHLTLARIAQLRAPPAPFAAPPPRIELTVDHVALVQSEPAPQGSRYTELSRVALS
jgi:2'-5' RNA ligase